MHPAHSYPSDFHAGWWSELEYLPLTVASFLAEHGMGQYTQPITSEGYDSMVYLCTIDYAELLPLVGSDDHAERLVVVRCLLAVSTAAMTPAQELRRWNEAALHLGLIADWQAAQRRVNEAGHYIVPYHA